MTLPLAGVNAAILTLSDTVARGQGADTSGDVIAEVLAGLGATIVRRDVLTDDREAISARLIEYADRMGVNLVLTTGGSGFAPRDVTPEATLAVVERLAPGLVEAARSQTFVTTPLAMLSRAVAGVRTRTLIVNLPGSPTAVGEWLAVLAPVLPHAVRLLKGDGPAWGQDHRSDAVPPR
ncbi:MAG: MogA/MoaB family molybdenum cofactor biosynthesis protein [bacterium]